MYFQVCQQFMDDVLHCWDVTFSHISDAGKIFYSLVDADLNCSFKMLALA